METIPAKNMLTRTKNNFWFGTDYNMNIYRGCSHGCIYCDSRSDCYGINAFDQVRAKEKALTILEDNLRRKTLKGVVGTGAMSDPYNPMEKKHQLTRQALELFKRYGYGVAIATKSPLVTRDKDLLLAIQKRSPVIIKITVTCFDDALSNIIEPQVAPSSARFAAIKSLSDHGIFTGILLMPILPFINDTPANIKAIVTAAAEQGARFIYPAFGVTLRDSQRLYYYDQLDAHFPGIKKEYLRRFGNAYSCASPQAKSLWTIFTRECQHYGLLYKMEDIVGHYKLEHGSQQLSFFD
ncbi:radical SAM protein [Acetobacterium wieringae]|uniref:Radical SAM protein n=1 Tax=Acetobacterium wieringae TaxID=52694 RepID=A0A5D0WHZ6_9FIRM|nr:radical SAM protein [Acetobacterium wieringae]TYC83867.1 radical SAM protein [Acetobacterium wieringae]